MWQRDGSSKFRKNNRMKKQATIVGAGLVGSLWAIYLNRAGFEVNVFERRPDMRKAKLSLGNQLI
jgi:kynurenine 3-monooxygenase